MRPGIYEICPVTFDGAAWPWGQIVIKPWTSSRFAVTPEPFEPAGSNADEADAYPRGLRLVGHTGWGA